MKTKFNLHTKLLFTVCMFSLVFVGCRRGADDVVENLTGDAFLNIQVDGINEVTTAVDPDALNADNSELKASVAKTKISRTNLVKKSFEGFDANITLKNERSENKVIASSKRSSSTGESKAAVNTMSPMPTGNTYKILLYKNGTYVKTVSAVSGTLIQVEVEKNILYDWYAYTFNTADPLPDVTSTSNPTIESVVDKPLLYSSGTVQVTGEGIVNKPLRLEFNHRTSRVGAEINARGVFAGLQSISASFAGTDYVKKGTLNLLTGQYENINAVNVGQLTFSNFSAATKDTIKVAYYYTAGQEALAPVTVNVQSLVLKLDKGDTRTFSTPFQYSNNLNSMEWGNRLTSAIDLVESPLTVAGVEWARANLYFSEADRAYRFRHQIEASYGRNGNEEYWNFKAPFPDGVIGSQDPCTRVYPLNTWRMPNRDEVQALVAVKDGTRTLVPDYVEYNATGTGSPYPSNRLRINKMGYFNLILGIFGVNEDGINGYFWSSETGFLGGLGTGVFCYRVSDNTQFPFNAGDRVWEHHALSSWGGTLNVRCVRDK